MEELLIIAIFILWYFFSLIISETLGKNRKIGVQWSFFTCMLLSPVFGYIITRVSPEGSKAMKKASSNTIGK